MLPSERTHRRGSPCERAAHPTRWSVHMPVAASCPGLDVAGSHTPRQPSVAPVQPVVGASTLLGDGDQLFWSSVVKCEMPAYCQANDRGLWYPGNQRVFLEATQTVAPTPGVVVCVPDRAQAIAPSRRSEIQGHHRPPERSANAHTVSSTSATSSYTSGRKEGQR